MDQNKCVALLTAIDLGNLTRAAEQLGYTQSGLSYLTRPETELGFPLLVRSRYRRPSHRGLQRFSLCCGTWTERAASWSRRPPISAAWPWAPSPWPPFPPSPVSGCRKSSGTSPSITPASPSPSGRAGRRSWMNGCGRARWTWPFAATMRTARITGFPSWRMKSGRGPQRAPSGLDCESSPWPSWPANPSSLEDRAYDYDISRVIQEAGVHPNVRWTSKDEPWPSWPWSGWSWASR